jgi:hypothetical protein
MLSEKITSASHAGEDQSSPDVFAARDAHWKNVLVGLFGAANTLAFIYLQGQRDSAQACVDADHHKAVVNLFNQVARAKALGLSAAGASQLATAGQVKVDIWSVIVEPFSASTLADLIDQNDWLRPGDVVYRAETVHRHTLTEADFPAAAVRAKIGGVQ